jgi:hypothetical protein
MAALTSMILRQLHARRPWPAGVRWTLCALVMRGWLRLLARTLRRELGDDARPWVAALAAETFRRRYAALRAEHPHLPAPEHSPRATALLFAGLYQLPLSARDAWILGGLGGAPRGREWLDVARLSRSLDAEARWRELTVHLGEALIVATERLPERVPRARAVLADMCFKLGEFYGRRMRDVLGLPAETPVANAIELLRGSEYLFRVNPEHRAGADEVAGAGFIVGDACPWYPRPGWQAGHCGIFGSFQGGVCAVFGLRYRLMETIPKHGGDHCRVELTTLRIRRPVDGSASR